MPNRTGLEQSRYEGGESEDEAALCPVEAPGNQNHPLMSLLDILPFEMLVEITDKVSDEDLFAWLCTNSTTFCLGLQEIVWRNRCKRQFCPLMEAAVSPYFANSIDPWLVRYKLLRKHLPLQLQRCQEEHLEYHSPVTTRRQLWSRILEVGNDGVTHTNTGPWTSILATRPFLTSTPNETPRNHFCNSSHFHKGVEYFELKLVINTQEFNRATAIGIAHAGFRRYDSFIGWSRSSVAYHSDDGTVRSVRLALSEAFSTGDIVGCGIDWSHNEVFFTKNGKHTAITVRDDLRGQAWYPCIGTMCRGDTVRVNFGQERFAFDLKHYEARRGEALANGLAPANLS